MKAFASIVCLGATCLMPRIARVTHAMWRALQAYDHQTPSSASAQKDGAPRAIREAATWFLFSMLCSFYNIVSAFYSLTADEEKLARQPILSSIRNSLPWLFVYVLAFLVVSAVFSSIFRRRDVYIKRLPGLDAKEHGTMQLQMGSQNRVSPPSKLLTRTSITGKMLCAGALVYGLAHYSGSPSSNGGWPSSELDGLPVVLLCALAGMLPFLSVSVYPLVAEKYCSFRGLCLLPFAVAVLTALGCMLVILAIVGVFVLIDLVFKTAIVLSSNESSNGVEKPAAAKFVDVAQEQFSVVFFAYVIPWVCVLPAVLLAMAYRFDAAQAGHSTLTNSEKTEMIGVPQTEERDTYGCFPVMVRKAVIRVPKKDLGMYHTAFYTLIATQLLGIALEFCLAWPFDAHFPRTKEQVTSLNTIFIPWPLVAYPMMLAAMLLRALFQSKQTFFDLWSYHEKWVREEGEGGPPAPASQTDADVDADKDIEAAKEEEPFLLKE